MVDGKIVELSNSDEDTIPEVCKTHQLSRLSSKIQICRIRWRAYLWNFHPC